MSEEFHERRVTRTLTDGDIEAIAQARSHSACRFERITEDDLTEAVNFYKNMNDALTTSKKTLWNTFLVFSLTTMLILMGLGVVMKVKGD